MIRQVGWITKATSSEKHFWRSSPNPHVRFYLANNPKFTDGNGLLTFIPITLVNLALSLPSIVFHMLKKKFRVIFKL